MVLLTKSLFLSGLSCLRHMWLRVHDPKGLTKATHSEQARRDGERIGELARTLFNGVDLSQLSFADNIAKTKESLMRRETIFEAGVECDGFFARSDILIPAEGDQWDIIEVKSSTRAKEEHLYDLAFQKYCYELSGLKIRATSLMHVNKEYCRGESLVAKDLFVQKDVTAEVEKIKDDIAQLAERMQDVLAQNTPPDISCGKGCKNGLACPSIGCWDSLGENTVFELYRGKKRAQQLFDCGVVQIKDIGADEKLTHKQQIQHKSLTQGQPYIDKEKIQQFLSSLQEPLYFLDFETFSSAIPFFSDVKPYQQIPFQFSCHIVNDGKTKHSGFLADGASDPRLLFIKSLRNVIGENGNIVVYNQSFEIARLKELATLFPDFALWIEGILPRFVDLLIPFREFSYYHPKQKGSCSIKKVLPVLCEYDYSHLDIQNGEIASASYLSLCNDELQVEQRQKIRVALEKYCTQDTHAMIDIVRALEKVVAK